MLIAFYFLSAMGKTPAEIQNAYRERKKLKEGSKYLERESKRVLAYCKTIADVSKKEATESRKNTREYVQKHREKKKIIIAAAEENAQNKIQNSVEIQNSKVSSSSSQDTTASMTTGPLIVILPTINPKKRSRARTSRSTSISRRKIRKLRTKSATKYKVQDSFKEIRTPNEEDDPKQRYRAINISI